MKLTIPELSLVVLIGPSGAGKSTFARRHFKPTEVISSDFCRGLVADDENDQAATKPAFEVLHFIIAKRLEAGRLTVVDATNVQPEARKPLVEIARKYHCLPVAVVFNVPEEICHERNKARPDRDFGPHVVRQHFQQMRRSLRNLSREGFRHVFMLESQEEIEGAVVDRQPLWNNRREEHGPFDIIGDIHGCHDELVALLAKLGYEISKTEPEVGDYGIRVVPPPGRRAVFLGDLVDRGPAIVGVLKLVMSMVKSGAAFCLPGNHDIKLLRKLNGRDVQITHGLADSLAQLAQEPPEFAEEVAAFIDNLVSHYVLDDGRLVVAHAGMKEEMQGRGSRGVREFALYGETTGEIDEYGLPIRYNWAAEYRGRAMVVYGHTPVAEPDWLNRTINIDTGCVFGGNLTALRYPEKELVSVPALHTYYEPAKPFLADEAQAPAVADARDEALDIDDVLGKRIVQTRLHRNITIREENTAAALEVMSRFSADPHWLIYLPPTMSPSETSKEADLLEHPAEAFAYYRNHGVPKVICEEKHMGSRAVIIACRTAEAAGKRFGMHDGTSGICYTRTGRHFFNEPAMEADLLETVGKACTEADLWSQLETDWVCLDSEIMPWSAKAQALLEEQYAPVGAAGRVSLRTAVELLAAADERGCDLADLADRYRLKSDLIDRYIQAYRRYCWPVDSLGDLKLAPFHLLAVEGRTLIDRDHLWHLNVLSKLTEADPGLFVATKHRVVDVTDPESESAAVRWWEELTGAGGEGMVVKPLDFAVRGPKGLLQPAVKCRGREYLRIIYGPEYTLPENIERLRKRSLSRKRSLALREFALGVEALERFVRREPLYRVHECVFGVLALESEPVDPRL
ncbi:MAG: polynucleotide kinase-phosphatase [Bacteroidota bacterium]